MNTDQLVDILSADLEPVNRGQLGKILIAAIVTGAAAAILLMLATFGPRSDFQSTAHLEWLALKLLFSVSVVGAAAPLLSRSIRPGLEDATDWRLILLPFFAALAIAVAALLLAQPDARVAMLRGATTISSLRCLLCIIFFATIPMAAVISAVRKGAPTRLRLSGAIAGVVAGGIGAAAYAFTCSSDTIPFIAIWYGGAILICAFIGAQLGPRLLRW
jgi:hypothetical protein